MMTLCILSPAPDTPDFLSRYRMLDYAEQTFGVNAIDDQLINATRRIICYNQPIYDDERLEVSEYAGLTLDVDDNLQFTTVRTEVQDLYDFASIRILDDDSEFYSSCETTNFTLLLLMSSGSGGFREDTVQGLRGCGCGQRMCCSDNAQHFLSSRVLFHCHHLN